MIDIHHHCLPGIDDGPKSWEEAVDQCRLAFSEGISTIVATPHSLRGNWQNDSPKVLQEMARELDRRLGGEPRIVCGSEYFFAHDMLERLQEPRAIVPLAGSRYVLVEFAAHSVPPMIESVFYRLQIDGWTPIIAHPERNLVFRARPQLLRSLIECGGKTQITAMSLTGELGDRIRKTSLDWIASGMVHVVATDAHGVERRPPRALEARARVEARFGASLASALFDENPGAIVDNRLLPWDPEPHGPPARNGFLTALKRLWGVQKNR